MSSSVVQQLLIGIVATFVGTIAAQWAIENWRPLRRAVGGL